MNQALSYLDVVIAFVAVLVMATSIVSTLTQLAIAILKKRREILIAHLTTLLKKVGVAEADAQPLATGVVSHPDVQGSSVVQRERLVEILLEKAVGNTAVSTALRTTLGVTDPQATLDAIRNRVLKLEADSPDLADHIRRTKAIVGNALAANETVVMEGIVKIMSGFDEACDQMTHAMQAHARALTIAFSVIVAIVLPLDSIAIVKQLERNPTVVQQLVDTAKGLKDAGASADQDDLKKLQDQLKTQTNQIANPALGIQPGALFDLEKWKGRSGADNWLLVFGILISIALMSLGAPFWFDALKNLLRLRPALATKETGERTQRATTTKST